MLRHDLLDSAMDEHVEWLRAIDDARACNFQRMRKSNREGAAAEALVAGHLRAWVEKVEPFEEPGRGGPDFCCTQDGQRFYVEVTALATDAVQKSSWIPDDPKWEGGSVGSISRIVRSSLSDKADQCANRDAPVLVALAIHHSWVSMDVRRLVRDVLISDESYMLAISPDHPMPTESGQFVTRLSHAIFMATEQSGVTPKRQSISGVLLFGLGIHPPRVVGLLNGSACRLFNVGLLPMIEFGEAVIIDDRVKIKWHNSSRRGGNTP